jgi:hypothetical protein
VSDFRKILYGTRQLTRIVIQETSSTSFLSAISIWHLPCVSNHKESSAENSQEAEEGRGLHLSAGHCSGELRRIRPREGHEPRNRKLQAKFWVDRTNVTQFQNIS